MASTNWNEAGKLQAKVPHTYSAMEHLIMSLADAYNSRGKTTFFGNDKGLKNYLKFEEKFKNLLYALVLDGLNDRHDDAEKFLQNVLGILELWQSIFPNWPDAEAFANEVIQSNHQNAKKLISISIGVK